MTRDDDEAKLLMQQQDTNLVEKSIGDSFIHVVRRSRQLPTNFAQLLQWHTRRVNAHETKVIRRRPPRTGATFRYVTIGKICPTPLHLDEKESGLRSNDNLYSQQR